MDAIKLIFVPCDRRAACSRCVFRLDDLPEHVSDDIDGCLFSNQEREEERIQCRAADERALPYGRTDGRDGYWEFDLD